MAIKNRRRNTSRPNKGGFFRKFFITLFIGVVLATAVSGFILFETEKPTLLLEKQIHSLGTNVDFPLTAKDNKSGIRSVEVVLEQNGKTSQLFNRSFNRQAWFKDAGPKIVEETLVIDAKKAQLTDGPASLIIRVRDFSLNSMMRGNETVQSIPVHIDTKPPKVMVTHAQRYIKPGGSGIVTYQLSEASKRHGVQIDNLFFQGFPTGKSSKQFVAYIALPWDSQEPSLTKVIAIDEAGNEGKSLLSFTFKPAKEKTDELNVSDGFLKNKTPEFEEQYPDVDGQMIDKYLYVNNEVRKQNAESIKKLCTNPSSSRFWKGRFLRMPGAKKAGFADQRTYFYKGKPVDYQTHLGIDLASTARADVRAANRGTVVFAEYMGIYGNMVIIDHGQGIFSLYSHLSRIDTAKGAMVDIDEHIGNTGTTGMAGGDHLHFSILVHGIFVTPVEWWDQHWIDVTIDAFVGPDPS